MNVSPLVTLRTRSDGDTEMLWRIAAELDTWEERGPDLPAPLTRAAFEARLAQQDDTSEYTARFIVETDGVAVGSVSLFNIDQFARRAEVGISLSAEARGLGIGTQAMRQIVEFAFVRCNFRRVHLEAIESNVAGLRVYEKVGFVVEGHLREHSWVRGHYENSVIMGLLRSEWELQQHSA